MEFLKDIFGDKSLTFEELETALKDNKDIKLVNLASGNYVAKDKFDKAELKAKELEQQLTTANDTIKSFEDLDVESLKQGVKDWESKYNAETEALNQKLAKQTKDSLINIALMQSKAKNIKATRALLNEDSISVDGDNLIGFKEQMESIIKDNAYMFGEETETNPHTFGGGEPQGDTLEEEFKEWETEAGLF